ncbi:MAG TPA: NAD(P)-dependent oxidoreductase [Aggregatilineales bacterium]|nr:NAD(P)-dependent oxidoreductase [Aggregatilineales bacterium]
MKILVAGATGVVGRNLIPLLIEAGHSVAGSSRHEKRTPLIRALGATPVVFDAHDRKAVFATLESQRPDVLIDQLTDLAERDFAANSRLRIEGTRHLIDAAKAAGVQRVIAQSISWAYIPGDSPAHEDEPLDLALDAPQSRRSLVQGTYALEQAVSEIPDHVILRYGLFYGPGTYYAQGGSIAEHVRLGKVTADDSVASFIHVEDAARAALLALNWPAGIFNIVDDEPAPSTEWLPIYAHLIGAPPPPLASGSARGERGASNKKARTVLGWKPLYPSWREGFNVALG